MAALTTPRLTPYKADGSLNQIGPVGVAAATTLYLGGVVCLNSAGNAVPGSTGASLICMGVLLNQPNVVPAGSVVNSGAANATQIQIDQGTFFLDNDPAAPLTAADIGHACLLNDDRTVSHLGPSNASRCIAGTVVGINATGTSEPIGVGVWVKIPAAQPFQGTGFGMYT